MPLTEVPLFEHEIDSLVELRRVGDHLAGGEPVNVAPDLPVPLPDTPRARLTFSQRSPADGGGLNRK